MDLTEKTRLVQLSMFEKKAYTQGFKIIAGIDEAGRGPLAGPVVAAACILPKRFLLPGINDSKKMTAKQREEVFDALTNHPKVTFGIGIIDHVLIDTLNIYQATIQAMLQAINKLAALPELLLVDGMTLPQANIPFWKIVEGDGLSISIGAASIIAKVTRDRLMNEYHHQWPHYGFNQHKGYGTEKHIKALETHGPCPIHRSSFEPVRKLLGLKIHAKDPENGDF